MPPAIGTISALAGQGRLGVVVSAQPVGDAQDGRQLTALTLRESKETYPGTTPLSHPRDVSREQELANIGIASLVNQGGDASDSPIAASAKLPGDLTAAERTDLTRLQQRDQQVRQEEKAHAAVAGDLAGPISYIYQRGPDGRQYAVGGSVGIQAVSSSLDPAEAKRIGARMAAAAHAATNPSLQDYAAARQAYAFASQITDKSQPNGGSGQLSLHI